MNKLIYSVLLGSLLLAVTSCSRNVIPSDDVFGAVLDEPVRSAIQAGDNDKLSQVLKEGADYQSADSRGFLPVHLAAQLNNVTALRLLKSYKADMNALDGRGNPPIHVAAIADAGDVLLWFIKDLKMSPDTLNSVGETPAQSLIRDGKNKALVTLVEQGVDVNQADPSGDTLLHKAVLASNPGAVSRLLELNAKPYAFNSRGYAPLHLSARIAKQEGVLKAFRDHGLDMNYPDASGDAPIHLSIRALAASSLQSLVELGADLERPDKDGLDLMTLAIKSNNARGIEILHNVGIPLDEYNPQGYASIHQAVVMRRKASLEALLKLGVNTEQPVRDKGTTALHLSARLGYTTMQKILQGAGADVRAVDQAGNSTIHYAAYFNKAKSIKQALAGGADVNRQNYSGQTPTHLAIEADSRVALRELLKSGADLTIRNVKGDQPLHTALELDNTSDVTLLLKSGADPNALNGLAVPPLFQSTLSGDVSSIDKLIKAGAKMDTTDSNGWYALHRAADAGRAKAILTLVQNGQFLEILTPNGDTAVHLASRKNQILAVRALARVGANIDKYNALKNTPLHSAVAEDAGDSIRELLDLGANIQLRDEGNLTPLLRAVVENKPESARLLTKYDSRGQRDAFGNTAVLLAMKANNNAMTNLLLRQGSSASEANFNGEKPLPLALKNGQYQLAELLTSYGADVTEPLDIKGNTACDLTTDATWHKSCRAYFRDSTYLSTRQRWINLGQPGQYHFSKWFSRIPQSRPKAKGTIAQIREQADFKMRYYLAFSDPDAYLTELIPPEESEYSVEKSSNESDQAYFERLDYIKNNYQNDYQKRLLHYENTKQHRLEEIAAFKSYHQKELPARRRVAVDINADAIQSKFRTPLRATAIDHDIFAGILTAQLSAPGFTMKLELKADRHGQYLDYLGEYGLGLPWYMGAAIDSEFFAITHVMVPTPGGYAYMLLNQEEYKYLLQRFISLRGKKTYSIND